MTKKPTLKQIKTSCCPPKKIKSTQFIPQDQHQIPRYHLYQHTGEGNPGYNYIAWSKNEIVKASELAEIIDLKPKWTIGKYDIQSCRWKTYVHGIGLEGTLFDFTIKQFDMIYIKVSEEKTLSL